jgi:hypothetical protein
MTEWTAAAIAGRDRTVDIDDLERLHRNLLSQSAFTGRRRVALAAL